MATQSSFYAVDGSTRTFPSTKHIPTKQHCAVYLKSLSLLTWSPASVDSYSLINNSIVFDTAPSSGLYSQVEIRIADLQSELVDSPSNIAIVAGNINNVNLVGQNINDVNTIGDNINALLVIPANLTAINNISTNITELLTIDESAAIATAMANICTSTYDQFDDRYLGAKATAPLVDNDGNALVYGSLYFDTTQNFMKVWSNAGWINAGSSVNGTTERYTYSATAGQTVFVATYEAGYIDVFLNGSKLQNGVDFTAVTATNITLTNPASVGDVVDIICYAVFELSTAPTKDVVAYTVSTVADLATVPSIYTTAIVKDTNRGGTFIWSSTGTANDGTVFAGATGFWTRQYSGALNVKWFGAVGDGVTDDTSSFNLAITYCGQTRTLEALDGRFVISSTLSFGYLIGFNVQTLVKATVFTGTYIVDCLNATFASVESVLYLDGIDKSVSGIKVSGPTTGMHTYNVYGKNLDLILSCEGNTEKAVFNIHGYNCNIFGACLNDGSAFTPDENVFNISGTNCNSAFIQNSFASSIINLNIESSGQFNGTSYCVEITDAKTISINGLIRGALAGGVLIDSNNVPVLFNLATYYTAINPAVKLNRIRNATGSIQIEAAEAGGLFVGNCTSAVLDCSIGGIIGTAYAITLGVFSSSFTARRVNLNCSFTAINASTVGLIDMNLISDSNIRISGSTGANAGINIGSISRTELSMPLTNNTDVLFTGLTTVFPINYTGGGSTTEILALTNLRNGMTVFDRTLGYYINRINGRWIDIKRQGTAAPTSGTFVAGDIVWNALPTAGGFIGWVCTTAGSPGTWKTFGVITV